MELVIKETLEKLLNVINVNFTGVKVTEEKENVYYVEIDTESTSLLIGWRGETVAAIQHVLKCLLWKQGIDSKTQVIVDIDGYKKRQEDSVIRMAEHKAEVAVETQKEIKLPPMSPYFRRKIHLHLAESEKFKNLVITDSVGEGNGRQVRIIPK